jgi:hypothetical protein
MHTPLPDHASLGTGHSRRATPILKLRAIASNGDFDDYWRHHLAQERHRVHETRYAQDVIPQAA